MAGLQWCVCRVAAVCHVGSVLFIKQCDHTLHISELKYVPTHGTFPSFLVVDKTAGAYSLQIYDYLSQIQRETNAFLLLVRHNTEGPPFSDWRWRHRTLFFFVGLKNPVNQMLFFKPWVYGYRKWWFFIWCESGILNKKCIHQLK